MCKFPDFPHFYFIFPNVFGFKGGVQVYSTFLLEALQNLYPQARYDVFLKYDQRAPQDDPFLSQTQFHCFGRWHRLLQSLFLGLSILVRGMWQQPQLLITTHANYSMVGYWLKRLAGVPYWVVIHGEEAWDLKNSRLQAALRDADKIVAVSRYTRDRVLAEGYLDPAKLSVLPNTFDASRFRIAPKPQYLLERYGLSPKQPVILTVTRLGRSSAEGKGYRQVLEALVRVRHEIPNVHYLLVGKGDDRDRVESLITRLDLTDCVTLTGFIPDTELCDHYNLCDVFALPSRIEGFGIVYLEALACGKPVLAGNDDGAVDPLDGGRLGVLVDPERVEEIARHLLDILQGSCDNPTLYQPERLRQNTIERFAFSRFQGHLAGLMRSLWGRSEVRPSNPEQNAKFFANFK
ncbi:glycosyltransferase [Lusitaniella coriacea]|uniref:glycosyltransferase n=1 Tax=Lusitaniella coriacea TaxID=1983105 RepID=UPI003CEDBF9A